MDEAEKYPLVIGMTFVFNLLLGTGVLAIPHVFKQVGYLMGSAVITSLAAMSYLSVTFLVETMANANFVSRLLRASSAPDGAVKPSSSESSSTSEEEVSVEESKSAQSESRKVDGNFMNSGFQSSNEKMMANVDQIQTVPHVPPKCLFLPFTADFFSIDTKFELGDLTGLFLYPLLSQFFFLSIIVYLFGDLMIFNAMMAKSMREISCSSPEKCNLTILTVSENPLPSIIDNNNNGRLEVDLPCWTSSLEFIPTLSRGQVYQIYLLVFVALLLPLAYAGLKKTQSIQVVTIVLRWLAFISMVGLALRKILLDGGPRGNPEPVNLRHMPKMFGVCVYGFMVHHSVPSILTAIRNKRRLLLGLQLDYLLVAACYLLIAGSAAFAFPTIEDVYTLNFQVDDCHHHHDSTITSSKTPAFFALLLPTYPVFTMFSSYTMIALTLINNLKVLAQGFPVCISTDGSGTLSKFAFPLMAMLPPLVIALFTENVSRLMGFVGSYAGGLIQYVFPCLLVYASRRAVQQQMMITTISLSRATEKPDDQRCLKRNLEEVRKLYRSLNTFASPLQSNAWILLTGAWWLLSLVLVTLDHASVFD